MFGDILTIYGISEAVVGFFTKPFEDALDDEVNEKIGVFDAVDRVKTLGSLDVNRSPVHNLNCLMVVLDPEKDPIAIILGTPIVYLTPAEIDYFDGVDYWDDDEVLAVLNHVLKAKAMRSRVYTSSKKQE